MLPGLLWGANSTTRTTEVTDREAHGCPSSSSANSSCLNSLPPRWMQRTGWLARIRQQYNPAVDLLFFNLIFFLLIHLCVFANGIVLMLSCCCWTLYM